MASRESRSGFRLRLIGGREAATVFPSRSTASSREAPDVVGVGVCRVLQKSLDEPARVAEVERGLPTICRIVSSCWSAEGQEQCSAQPP